MVCCGCTGPLDAAAGSSLVVSKVFGVSVWDTYRVILVGDELSPVYLTGVKSAVSGASDLRW